MEGFEETLDELTRLVQRRAADPDPARHIHVAWLCVHEGGRRVEDAEQNLCRMLAQHVPVLGVITKARRDAGFRAKVQGLLPEAANVVRVRAISETDDDGNTLDPMGLEDLVFATVELLPEGTRGAIIAAQRASMRLKMAQASQIVFRYSGLAAAAAANPIPVADAAALVAVHYRMLGRLSVLFGFDVTEPYLRALVVAAVGPAAAAAGGHAIVRGLLKLIPGGGAVVGGAIAAANAFTLTTALGKLYIATLDAQFAKTAQGDVPDRTKVAEEFGKRAKKARGDTPLGRLQRGIGTRLGRLRRGVGNLPPFRKSSGASATRPRTPDS
ncbi:MAG: DUF697 domain-containing protein [Gemmatimonadetes bacterium]|nr:DUF697 domain-containing protein [Gemmatimonadota bacterium]MCY3943863.1 DUF697 domain-containing protein [Gemmatimonadota bacterium]